MSRYYKCGTSTRVDMSPMTYDRARKARIERSGSTAFDILIFAAIIGLIALAMI